MNPRRLGHLMEVQRLRTTDDGFGDGTPNHWEKIKERMFSLVPGNGQERQEANQIVSSVTHQARCRYFTGANSRMRLKYGERIFQVDSVVNDMEDNRFLLWSLTEEPT